MSESFDEIAETFAFLDEWEDRYRYVIDLGKAMPDLDPSLQVPATKVDGCASQVWIVPEIEGQVLNFTGTSDAMIVRGLIAVLLSLYNGKTAQEALAIDAPDKLAGLGLDQHLSAQRSNGLRAMIARIREIATRTVETA
jgi:cysteine desulfuration protein SufE